jgi:propanol-preferring alcohol dehydrogenase/NAD+-dependent secondary alcohol dehydrogenase Adh1
MKAVRVFRYHEAPRLVDVPEPRIVNPNDVIVKIAGAGICRTDLHIIEGGLDEAFHPTLPHTLGHENSGWIEAVGSGVTHLATGDPVILHPAITCGFCDACRAGNDMHCPTWGFPGVDGLDGGYAEYMRTSARSVVKLAPGTDPASLAPHADAGLTDMHAVKQIVPFTYPGSTVVVVGVGGLGHIAIQLLHALTAARVVAVATRPERAEFARRFGADEIVMTGSDGGYSAVMDLTNGIGADAVLDLVGDGDVPAQAIRMVRKGGAYVIVGYGGKVEIELLDAINRDLKVLGSQIGSYTELVELMELDHQGRIVSESQRFPLDDAVDALDEVRRGRVMGRAILVPG